MQSPVDRYLAIMAVDPYTEAHAILSIAVNGLLLKAPDVPESLLRFVRPLAFYNEGHSHELSFSGTSLRVRVRGRNLLLCSRHQLTNADRLPKDIVIILDVEDGRRIAVNPNEVSQRILDPSSDTSLSDLADVLLAEYAPRSTERDLRPHFLDMDLLAMPDLTGTPAEAVDAIFTLGFPTTDTDYDTSFDDDFNVTGVDIVSRWWKLYLLPAQPTEWDRLGLAPLEPARSSDPIPDDPDGMSGAPVFFISGLRQRQPRLGFAGMILRANKLGRANMLEAEVIRRAVRMHLDG